LAKLSVLGQQVWAESRRTNDFARFRTVLERIIALKREEAAAIGFKDDAYDALLDEYEPGETTANVAGVLSHLREQLVPLVAQIAASRRRPNLAVLAGYLAPCMKRATACMSRVCRASASACPAARPRRWASMNRNLGCGKI
jgi:carboxypeptidase Taq